MSQTTFYVVEIGRQPGIYTKIEDAQLQTTGYPLGSFKTFETLELAQNYFADLLRIEEEKHDSRTKVVPYWSYEQFKTSEYVQNYLSTYYYETMRLYKYNVFYAVKVGKRPGIYEYYQDAVKQISGVPNGFFKEFKSFRLALDFLRSPAMTPDDEISFYAVLFGRKPGIYEKLVDALKQTLGFPSGYFKKFRTFNCAQNYLNDPLTYHGESVFYSVKNGHQTGIYKRLEDAQQQIENFPGGLFSRFENLGDALNYLESTMPCENEVAFYAVKIGRNPGIYFTKVEAEKQTRDFCGSYVKKFETLELARLFLSGCLNVNNAIDIAGVSSEYKPVMSNTKHANSKLSKKCCNKEAFECVKVTKDKRTGKDISCLVTKKIKVDESGSYVPTLRILEESLAVFASGEIVDEYNVKRAGIGVYWGPNHPLNISKRITGIECPLQVKKYAVVHAVYQTIQSNPKKVKLYCDWPYAENFAQWNAIDSNLNIDLKVKDDLSTLRLLDKDMDIKYMFIHKRRGRPNEMPLPIKDNPSYSYYEGYKGELPGTFYAKQGMWEANKLALVGCKLCLVIENISEFVSDYNRKKKSLCDHNPFEVEHLIKENVLPPALNKRSSPVFPNEPKKIPCYYAVHKGHLPGIYSTWEDCKKQVMSFPKAIFKKFYSEDDANQFVLTGDVPKSTHIVIPVPTTDVTNDNDDAQQFALTDEVCKSAQSKLLVPKIELNNDKDNAQQSFLNSEVYKSAQSGLLVQTTELNSDKDNAQQFLLGEVCRNTQIVLIVPKEEVNSGKEDAQMFVPTGEVHQNSQIELFVPKEEINSDEDNKEQLVLTGEVPKSSKLKLLVSKTEAMNNEDVCISSQVEGILPKTEVNNDKDDSEKCPQVELTVPKTKVTDEEFVDIFICGRSFISDIQRAGMGIYWGPENALNTSLRLLGEQINNRADIWAAIHAFRQAKMLYLKNVSVYTDSQFIVKDVITFFKKYKQKNWEMGEGFPVVYKEDFKLLDEAMTGLRVKWCHVKERNSCFGFVEAERLAVTGCNKIAVETKAGICEDMILPGIES